MVKDTACPIPILRCALLWLLGLFVVFGPLLTWLAVLSESDQAPTWYQSLHDTWEHTMSFRRGSIAYAHWLRISAGPFFGMVLAGWLLAQHAKSSQGRLARTWRSLRKRLDRDLPALDLAVARVVIFAVILRTIRGLELEPYLGIPAQFQMLPPGAVIIYSVFPPTEWIVHVLPPTLMLACMLALLGVRLRWSGTVAALLALYLFGAPNLYGKVNHGHMHMWWFALVIAHSPADRRLVPLRLVQWGCAPEAAQWVSGRGLRLLWLTMGALYLTAGLGKLRRAGQDWLNPDYHLLHVERIHWTLGSTPILESVASSPALLMPGAVFVLVLQLTFILLVLERRPRLIAFAGGILFHVSTHLLIGIRFTSLLLMYPILLPWQSIVNRIRGRVHSEAEQRTDGQVNQSVVNLLVASFVLYGFVFSTMKQERNAWPISVYPQFAPSMGVLSSRVFTERQLVARNDQGVLVLSESGDTLSGINRAHRIALLNRTLHLLENSDASRDMDDALQLFRLDSAALGEGTCLLLVDNVWLIGTAREEGPLAVQVRRTWRVEAGDVIEEECE